MMLRPKGHEVEDLVTAGHTSKPGEGAAGEGYLDNGVDEEQCRGYSQGNRREGGTQRRSLPVERHDSIVGMKIGMQTKLISTVP
ncbi:hypothetical protein RRF57_013354 [Xylaria bambusicola]|uniref:Uncharacterized protein n=1 Tax=Xylaria bambusicola TaxID=326684 RepID=A0AAN7V6G2_9PEZI